MTKNLVVSDSSTLILLVKSGLVNVLVKKFRVFIPQIVFEETVTKGKESGRWDALKIDALVNEKLVKIKEPAKNTLEKISAGFNLHRGELHAISLALDLKAGFLLTDDLKAMNACKVLGIKFVNALSLVLAMFEAKDIMKKTATEAFIKLEEFGWYSPAIINELKKKLEEVKK